jgi:UDP-N-acetylmuramoyl-tripeptide--D-alanyl-D-alanine ligase
MKALYAIYLQHPNVYIDTRKDIKAGMFFAVGQRNDLGVHRGNQFAVQAIESGQAAYAIINDKALKAIYASDERYILVEDSEKCLQALAKYHRQQLTCPFLAIAGSNGKTTIKELLSAVLSYNYKVFATEGNLNNYLGVPLSLLKIQKDCGFAILEIGANHLDETRFLAEIIQPNFGVVTNCGKDHLGEYGSVENIIRANQELYDYLAENKQIAFVSNNDDTLMHISKHCQGRYIYGTKQPVSATIINSPFLGVKVDFFPDNSQTIQSNLFGKFWVDTILGAAAIGYYFDIQPAAIQEAIESYQPAALRSQLVEGKHNKILLDCYNANPSSMEVFLKEIQYSHLQASKVLILGEMLELGSYSKAEHQELVNSIFSDRFEDVILIGEEFTRVDIPKRPNQQHFIDRDAAEQYLKQQAYKNKYFFVKGSRANRLELLMQMYL